MLVISGDIDTFAVAFLVIWCTADFAAAPDAGFVRIANGFAVAAMLRIGLHIHALSVAIGQRAVAACFVGIGAAAVHTDLIHADCIAVAAMRRIDFKIKAICAACLQTGFTAAGYQLLLLACAIIVASACGCGSQTEHHDPAKFLLLMLFHIAHPNGKKQGCVEPAWI